MLLRFLYTPQTCPWLHVILFSENGYKTYQYQLKLVFIVNFLPALLALDTKGKKSLEV